MPPNDEPSSTRTLLQIWTPFPVLGLLGPFFARWGNLNQSQSEIKRMGKKRKIITGTPKQTLLTCNFSFKCMTIHLVKNKLNSLVSGGPTRWSTFRVFQSKSHRKQGYVALPFWENPSAKTPYVTLDTLFPVTEVVFYTTCTWPPQGAVQGILIKTVFLKTFFLISHSN